jgi:hypothetical protein
MALAKTAFDMVKPGYELFLQNLPLLFFFIKIEYTVYILLCLYALLHVFSGNANTLSFIIYRYCKTVLSMYQKRKTDDVLLPSQHLPSASARVSLPEPATKRNTIGI